MRRAAPDGRWSWLDARLVPAAATVWAVTLAAARVSPVVLAGVALGAGAAAARVLGSARPRWPRAGRHPEWRRPAAVALVLTALAVTCALGAVRGQLQRESAVHPVAAAGGTVVAELVLRSDPRPLPTAGPGRAIADADLTRLDQGGRSTGLGGDPVLLFVPADGWVGLLPGQQLRVRAEVAAPREPGDVVAVLTVQGPPELLGDAGSVQELAGAVRSALADSAQRVLPAPAAGLLPGLVVGDTSEMDPGLEDEFRAAGLSHLTAVSGANVAIVLTLLLWPLRRRLVDRRWQAVAGALGVLGFVVLARPSASVVRAAAMAGVTLLALASGRPRAAVPALCAAVVVLLLGRPGFATDPGFALSVAATAAIVLLSPGWARGLRRRGVPALLADALAVSAAAGAATAPLVAGLSGQVSLVSLPANLLAAPAVAPATVLGLLAALLAPLVPGVGDLLTWCAGWPVRWLVLVAERAAAVPDGTARWPAGTLGAATLTVVLVAVVWALVRWPRLRPLSLAALVGVLALGWPVRQVTRGWPVPDTVVVACDVGQGDALVLPTGPGSGVLVDAGPDPGLVDACLTRLGIDALPLVLLSHLDADHVTGLAAALDGRTVGEVATGALSPSDERVPALDEVLRDAGVERVTLLPGDHRQVGTATFEVLAPDPGRATAAADPNDLSMVVRATQRGVRVLLTGDLGADSERRVLASGADLRADVLKVPHHGSGDVDPDFLAATGAAVALISVAADNTYGHPAPTLLAELARDGMRVLRTDQGGDLAVAGSAGDWGVAERGRGTAPRAAPGAATPPAPGPPASPTATARSTPQAPWPRAPGSPTRSPDRRPWPARGRAWPAGRWGSRRSRPGPSEVRGTMPGWLRPRWNRRPGCGSCWVRRSCCGPARSPPSGQPPEPATRTPRSTRWPRSGSRWARWPTRWRPRCSVGTGWSWSPGCTRPPAPWSTRWPPTRRTRTRR
ncbi:MBL fold metallo-hydrolase [Modestobacter sp. I12A-02628]|uniref:MBL fold metallo-hydrolase n=1 Tax=Goekera deserti TaxID=2497753 RepID=A0A7K3WDT5_9ACTN|nr:ComEC/Rec2 family competence protein [Goekera deserti]MPQ97464.1 MBL fold metallo-hydrolase [Goekera deserti]NDI47935.1 MBL fold metallo-hydrolase [Goekera deserti]NEL53683.1 MBL fold metallo-hydrolase [Goekera deserti]